MKKRLSNIFLNAYLVIMLFCLLIISVFGSIFIEKYLEHSVSGELYQKAVRLAQEEAIIQAFSSSNLDELEHILSLDADYHNVIIGLINSEGKIVLSTSTDISPDKPIDIKNFDPVDWGDSYYQTGDFFGYFDSEYLSVMAPVTDDMTIEGYLCIHYLMSSLYKERSDILWITYLIFLLVYAMLSLLIFVYRKHVHLPLKKITKGTEEFANGNFSYKISVDSDDEMGYLANSLNYMAEKMNRNGEYQRRFISDISHDFRSPLTSIKGYVDAMLDGTIPVEMQEKYLKIIAFEAERLEKLTRGLLTLNKLDVQSRMMNIQKFDINAVIKTTAEAFEGICTQRMIRLELILSGKELYAMADMEQIQQVLYNLLNNAIKFSYDDSSIILETTEKNDKIFVSVKDHGIGIPKENIHKIWDRFYKTDASRGKDPKGVGLGLAIVKEIINAHKQNINVVSTEDVGTEFIFTLQKAR